MAKEDKDLTFTNVDHKIEEGDEENTSQKTFVFNRNKKIDQELVPDCVKIEESGLRQSAVLEFDIEEMPPEPFLKIKNGHGETYCIAIENKIVVGSSENCTAHIEDPRVPEIYCILGFRNGHILVKHPGPHSIKFHGEELLPMKTYKIPFSTKFQVGGTNSIEILRNRPLDIEIRKKKVKKKEVVKVVDDSNEKKEDLPKWKKILALIVLIITDPLRFISLLKGKNDKESKKEIDTTVVNYELEREKVLHNFRDKRDNFFLPFRPLIYMFHLLLEDIGLVDKKAKERCLLHIKEVEEECKDETIKHLMTLEGMTKKMAIQFIENGVSSIENIPTLKDAKIKNILECTSNQASNFKEEVKNLLEEKQIESSSEKVAQLESHTKNALIELHEQIKALDVRPNFTKRIWAFSFTAVVSLFCSELLQDRIPLPSFLRDLKWSIPESLSPEQFDALAMLSLSSKSKMISFNVTPYLKLLVGWFLIELFCHLLFSVSLGQFILGIKSKDSIVTSRLKGVLRLGFNIVLTPFIFLFFGPLFKFRTLPEILSFSTLQKRLRPIYVEIPTLILTIGTTAFLIEQKKELFYKTQDIKKGLLAFESNKKKHDPGNDKKKIVPIESNVNQFLGKRVGVAMEIKGQISKVGLNDPKTGVTLKVGEVIFQGDQIETKDGSSVWIHLDTGHLVELRQKSMARFFHLDEEDHGPQMANVIHGKIFFTHKNKNAKHRISPIYITTTESLAKIKNAQGILFSRKSLLLTSLYIEEGTSQFIPHGPFSKKESLNNFEVQLSSQYVREISSREYAVAYINELSVSLPTPLGNQRTPSSIRTGNVDSIVDRLMDLGQGGEVNTTSGLYTLPSRLNDSPVSRQDQIISIKNRTHNKSIVYNSEYLLFDHTRQLTTLNFRSRITWPK